MSAEPFPVTRMAEVDRDLERPRWLVESLWSDAGVGILGGSPKSYKTFLALDIAVSVASGTPCLDLFEVPQPGPALLFLAEDSAASAHERVAGLCQHRSIGLDALDLFLLTTPVLCLDSAVDYERLGATVAAFRPRLLVLDPFVRIHRSIDENSATEVSRLLSGLTELKRSFDLAILLVHHVRKNGSGHPGQALRGSGDFRAWSDSNLYLKRHADTLQLVSEHRAAPAIDPFSLKLLTGSDGSCPHLAVADNHPPADLAPPLSTNVLQVLRQADKPLTRTALRQTLRVNNQRLGDALAHLERAGHIYHDARGWRLDTSFRSQPLREDENDTITRSSERERRQQQTLFEPPPTPRSLSS
jgi:hypothetical protein